MNDELNIWPIGKSSTAIKYQLFLAANCRERHVSEIYWVFISVHVKANRLKCEAFHMNISFIHISFSL